MSLRTSLRFVLVALVGFGCAAKEVGGDMSSAGATAGTFPAGATGGAAGAPAGVGGAIGGAAGMTPGSGGVDGNVIAGAGAVAGVGGVTAGVGGGGVGGAPAGDCTSTVIGAMYSPGGTVLPFPCDPFHPTTNNPYAVRCVDAWAHYDTGFPGDDFCILPPPPDKGFQYGVHPQGKDWYAQVSTGDMSGYMNPPAEFVLPSGGEVERNYYTSTDNTTEVNFYRNYPRMRAGSHHMIVVADAKNAQLEVWGPGSPGGLFSGTGLPGAQRPDENAPKSLEKPAEDAGYYSVMPANTGVTFDMHHFNATAENILKEAWTNIWFEDDATKRVSGLRGLDLIQVATMAIQPGQTVDYHYLLSAPTRTRIVTLFGHRHAWTTNFSAWIDKGAGDLEILYQSFNWYDEPTYRYDSLTMNPVPDFGALTDGAATGVRWLEPGQNLHFNCRIQYTDARAAAVNAPIRPAENGTLGFANEAFTAEMCILFGQTAEGPALNAPAIAVTPLPDFAVAQ